MNALSLRSLLLFIFTLPVLVQAQVPTKGLLYEVSGKGIKKPSYIFGTFHLLKSDYLKEVKGLEDAFNKTKGVVVEVDVKPEDILLITNAMVMPDKKLTDLLTQEEQNLLDGKLIEKTGMGIGMYNTIKPVGIVALLSVNMPAEVKSKIDAYQGDPMDMYFMKRAKETGKTITGLETAAEQANILFGDSLPKQVEALKKYIAHINDADTVTTQLVDNYFKHNLAALYKLSTQYNTDFATTADMDKLLATRNNRWLKALPALFKKEPQFIAVGALHLAGEEGLIYQLRKMGYTVKAVE